MTATAAPATRGQVFAWTLWDWGSSAFNAVTVTFVFSVYLVGSVGAQLPGPVSAQSWLGYGLGASGFLIAVLAPVVGRGSDAPGRRRWWLGVWTGLTVAAMAGMVTVRDEATWFWLGLALLAAGAVFSELAQVSYNALLPRVSTPATIGRVSGFGWAMGYLGGIVLLLALYVGLLAGGGGLLGVSTEDGFAVRLAILLAAAWFAVFALPVLLTFPDDPPPATRPPRTGVVEAYRALLRDVRELYRDAPHTVYFLGASAVFRDGLAAIFSFGAVLAVTVYGVAPGDVLLFGVAANVAAALGALVAGRLDDAVGPKQVIVWALVGLLACGVTLLVVSGPTMFWVFGTALTVFVGPVQASARTYLARLCPPGREGQLFGLYATTGRAVSFLSPVLVGVFGTVFGSDRAGIAGILLVLLAGLLLLLPLRAPAAYRTGA
ncbi:MAG: MFS transporter [Pseudonocardia sp.]